MTRDQIIQRLESIEMDLTHLRSDILKLRGDDYHLVSAEEEVSDAKDCVEVAIGNLRRA